MAQAGIDFNLAGNGGPSCARFISFHRRCVEAVAALVCCAVAAFIGWKIHSPPKYNHSRFDTLQPGKPY
jgi:hypothetical protein